MAQEEDTDTALAEEIRQAHQKLKAAESLFLQKVGHELTADERKMAQLLAVSAFHLHKNFENIFFLSPSTKYPIFTDKKWYDFVKANIKCPTTWKEGEKPAACVYQDTRGFDFCQSCITDTRKKEENSPYTAVVHAQRDFLTAESKRSHIILCKKMEKTEDNEYGFAYTDSIPIDKPAVLFLGGTGTETNHAANGNMSIIRDFFKENNFTDDVGIYSVIYEFGEDINTKFNNFSARRKLFADHFVPTTYKKSRIVGNKYI